MTSFKKPPVIYLCLLLFAVVLVLFEYQLGRPTDWKRPSSAYFRLPDVKFDVGLHLSASGGGELKSSNDSPSGIEVISTIPLGRQVPLKTILVWTFGYGSKTMGLEEGQKPFKVSGCEVDTCFLTANRTLLPVTHYDAIIFHFRSLNRNDLPAARSPHQRWIFWESESASYIYQNPAIYDGRFNWTMTYRLDSDIQRRYGIVYPVPSSPVLSNGKEKNYASGKTRMAAWFVSNCVTISRREKIVKFLKRFIQVDVYGRCGNLSCPRNQSSRCQTMLDQHYKFYLSFENSLCKDYVTEKLFRMLKRDVIPVVFGLANYTAIAPPHSFINVMDFPTIKGLVNYLKYLDANDTAYNQYFKWKGHYHVEEGKDSMRRSVCDLCKKLHYDNTPKVYNNLVKWFVFKSTCKKLYT